MSNNENKKTETKMHVSEGGELVKAEVPVLEMPETITDINFEPNDDVIIAEMIPIATETKSGILIPEGAQTDRAPKALILAVGEKISKYKTGDVIVFRQGVQPMELNGKLLFTMSEYHVIGKYKV